jgi:hypothetical protein
LKGYGLIYRGIVDKNVEATEEANSLLDRGFARGGLALIQMDQNGLSPLSLDFAADRQAFIAVTQVSQRDIHPFGSKRSRYHSSQATGCTRNQCCSIA